MCRSLSSVSGAVFLKKTVSQPRVGLTHHLPAPGWDFVCLGFLHICHRCSEFIGTVSLLCLETRLADAIHYLWLLQFIWTLFLDDSDSLEEGVI